MAGTTGRLCKVSWKKETTWGTYVDPDMHLSAKSENLDGKVDTVQDDRLIGKIFPSKLIKTGQTVSGSVPVTVHPEEVGYQFYGALGKAAAATAAPAGKIMIYYTGTDAYASLTIATGVLTAETGADAGSATTSWTFDTSASGYDTIAELAAAINAETDWACYAFGKTSASSASVADMTETAFNGSMIVSFPIASSSAYEHYVYPAGAAEAMPSFSLCADRTIGTGKAFGYDGMKLNQLSYDLSASAIVEGTLGFTGRAQTLSKTYPTITIPDDNPYTTGKVRVFLGGLEISEFTKTTVNVNNAMDSSHVIGSDYIIEQERGAATLEVSGEMNLVQSQWETLYPNYQGNTPLEMVLYWENVDFADSTREIPYSVLIKLPAVQFSDYGTFASGPDRLTSSISAMAVDKTGYTNQIMVYVTDTKAAY